MLPSWTTSLKMIDTAFLLVKYFVYRKTQNTTDSYLIYKYI